MFSDGFVLANIPTNKARGEGCQEPRSIDIDQTKIFEDARKDYDLGSIPFYKSVPTDQIMIRSTGGGVRIR